MDANFTTSTLEQVAAQKFDYIIIGGGVRSLRYISSAPFASTFHRSLAGRLSENPQISVLLLEAGPGRIGDPLIDMPTGFPQQFGNPAYDWIFETVPQRGLDGKTLTWNRGKGLGGSSNMNYMAWMHPGKEEINAWERLGNPGWNYENFISYVKKAENFHPPSEDTLRMESLTVDASSYGKNGPIEISHPTFSTGAEPVVRKTMEGLGIPILRDPVNGNYSGAWASPSTWNPVSLTRSSAFTGYILPNVHRDNLFVLTEAYATKLVLRNDQLDLVTAEGVEFLHDGKSFTVFAKKEVLLCAGALKSPQILELSGIGNRKVLEPLGIPVRIDLPGVGENLQEHLADFSLGFELKPDVDILSLDILADTEQLQHYVALYQEKKPGMLSFTASGVAYLSLQSMSNAASEIISRHENRLLNRAESSPGLDEQMKLLMERLKNPNLPECEIITNPVFGGFINKSEPQKRYLSIVICMMQPWSRGMAHIVSTDPLQHATFDPDVFQHEVELDTLLEAFKFSRSLINFEPLKSVISKEVNPGPAIKSDEEIKAHIKQYIKTLWHTSSTLSMLPREKCGVVDPMLKVWGTSNIRVCDLSIIPLQVGIHTQSIVYGIAEKAADLITGHV